MKGFLKWVGRTLGIGVLWVFIFSVRVQGETLFYHANELLVQNRVVSEIDEGLAELWFKVSKTAAKTFNELSKKTDEEA